MHSILAILLLQFACDAIAGNDQSSPGDKDLDEAIKWLEADKSSPAPSEEPGEPSAPLSKSAESSSRRELPAAELEPTVPAPAPTPELPAGKVVLAQPPAEGGEYGCRKIVKSEKDILARDGGCWTVKDFTCDGVDGQQYHPFLEKEEDCYVGRIDLPLDLCVDGIELTGLWDHACGHERKVLFSYCGDGTNKTVEFWDPSQRACSLRFYRRNITVTPGASVRLAQPPKGTSSQAYSCHEVRVSEDLLLSNEYNCWTMNDFTCPGAKADLPFKSGDECFLGEIDLPDDLCAEGLRLRGSWNLRGGECGDDADVLFSYCGGGRHEFWDDDTANRACAVRFSKKPKSSGPIVRLEQPMEMLGNYKCRHIDMTESELLNENNGCWDVGMFECPATSGLSNNLPFKWGDECYFGRITVPDGLCVDLFPLKGYWDEKKYCWSATEEPWKRVCGGGYYDFWDFAKERICAVRFSKPTVTKRMEIKAEWKLLSCSTQIKGELVHEVMVGITNESKYTKEFEKMVKNQFIAGMHFHIGPVAKNKLTGEGAKIFENAWTTETEQETVDEVACEVFGGTWCMWQWDFTFSQGSQVAYWNSPITQCTGGTLPPPPPHSTPVEPEPSNASLSADSSYLLVSSCSFILMALSMALASRLAVRLRHSNIDQAHLQEPLCPAS
eukprot:gnl/TRDRNA2_/TRDRNA2_44889_c0_seq1.p1 gnl/TRDRNA2_/TRDRNA2_44889_c0~~gnl/TRDRNA2_/TRDRNA2_44889_c0_seq1.p1  ORF type:complete len:668 (-),score=112.93 gnl/TRDRNA2_/TRDRNA2_44889_c0_seq1:92-2095(-)